MRQQIVGDAEALTPEMLDSYLQIDGVPVNDSRGDEAQARCAEALVLKCAVADFTLGEYGSEDQPKPQRVVPSNIRLDTASRWPDPR